MSQIEETEELGDEVGYLEEQLDWLVMPSGRR